MFFMFVISLSNSAVSEECNIRANVIDMRDNALQFDPTLEHKFRSELGGVNCDTRISATNLAYPRSKMTQDLVNGINSYSQRLNISQVALQGQGELKFMSVDFSHSSITYRLDIYVAPGRIPKGELTPSSYKLHGIWLAFDYEGAVIENSLAFMTPEIAQDRNIFLNWKAISENTKIELLVDDVVVPIRSYGSFGTNTPTPFFPLARTIGSLSETSLTPQTSFVLSSASTCFRDGEVRPVSCD